MKLTQGRLCASATTLLILVLVAGLAGQAAEPLSMVPEQVSAALYVQHWSQILWGMVTSQTGTETPSFGEPVLNLDGSISQSFRAADGTQSILTAFPDGSARVDIVLPEGTSQTVLQSVPVFDGVSITTMDWWVTSSEGLLVEYQSAVDDRQTIFDMSDDITELVGSAVLPGGITQEFYVLSADGMTDVQSTQSDGSTFTLSVPLALPDFSYPDFSQNAVGTYSGTDFSVHFVLTATPKFPFRWAALLSDLGGGAAGTFSLHSDFSGFGQLTESNAWGETLVALVAWTQYGKIDVYLLDGQDRYMGPSGAALDFLENRWQTLAALLAPAPGGSASVNRHDRLRRAPRVRGERPRLHGTVDRALPSPPQSSTQRSEGSLSSPQGGSSYDRRDQSLAMPR
ncbi:MAG: hypothetical protein MUQ65_09040 [Armatimonadetes bacterium]|nr:hypothetical protein [Armatimonadota bacterium]